MQTKVIGSGAPLVLVPDGLTGWLGWEQHAMRLLTRRQVIRVQLLAVEYGLARRRLPEDYSARTESRALDTALDALGLPRSADVAGWSFGGTVALDFALERPEHVRTLTLVEPLAPWVLGAERPRDREYAELVALSERIGDSVSEGELEQFLCNIGLCASHVPVREMPQWPQWVKHRHSLLNLSAGLRHADDPARLASLQRPVLLVKGTGSAPFLHQIVEALARQLPQARVLELPGGHAPHLVSMDRFLTEMLSFQGAVSDDATGTDSSAARSP